MLERENKTKRMNKKSNYSPEARLGEMEGREEGAAPVDCRHLLLFILDTFIPGCLACTGDICFVFVCVLTLGQLVRGKGRAD